MSDSWKDDKSFLGRGWAFPPAFDRGEQSAVMVAAEDDIRESLRILLCTIPGERVMLPDYGCSLHEHVFEAADETLFTHLRELIETAILYYEPRIIVENIQVYMEDQYEGRLRIDLDYRVIQTNTRNNMVIPFYLKGEGTLVSLAEAV